MSEAAKRKYVRSQPHNKISRKMLNQLRKMLDAEVPKSRIAAALGIHRSHLYRLIDKYRK